MLGFEGERQDINGKVIELNYLIQNNCFNQYKGEVILFNLIKALSLENTALKVSANNYFNFYEQFVDQLQMQNREAYKWTMQKVILANWGKFFYLF